MNFFVNKAMGHGNSGVEHAQFYRADLFKSKNISFKYIFTELLPDLHQHMHEWKLQEDEVINIFDFFMSSNPDQYLEKGLTTPYEAPEKYKTTKDFTDTHRLATRRSTAGYTIELLKNKRYSDERKLYLVGDDRYFLKNGPIEMMWHVHEGPGDWRQMRSITINNFKGEFLRFEAFDDLLMYFYQYLNKFFQKNVYIIDRGVENEEALVKLKQQGGNFKLVDIVHAAHLSRFQAGHPLWNNYYQFMFDHIDMMDRVVVATELQQKEIVSDLARVGIDAQTTVKMIPVGGVEKVMPPHRLNGKQVKFVTASRLHPEKHISQIVQALKILIDAGYDATLDIYGAGSDELPLKNLIKELKLEGVAHVLGLSQHVPRDIQDDDVFISASYSEGFGLTNLEALGAGLPLISYANKYGAQELVADKKNGYLVDFENSMNDQAVAQNIVNLAEAMKKVYVNYDRLARGAHKTAKNYQNAVIANLWAEFMEELG